MTSTPQPGLRARPDIYWLLLLPVTAVLILLYAVPVGRVLAISFTEPSLGFDNYARLISSTSIQRIFFTTGRICLGTTVVTMVLGYVVAYAMAHVGERHRMSMLLFILVPFWVSVLIRSFAWVVLLQPEGVINTLLMKIGLIDQPLQLVRNELGVYIGMVHYMLPIAILPLYANLRGIDPNLVLAARGLGSGPLEAFWRVYLPQSFSGLAGGFVLVFIFSLGFYVTPTILGGGRTVMLAEYIGIQILTLAKWGVGAMLSAVLLAAVVLVLLAVSRVIDMRKLFGAK